MMQARPPLGVYQVSVRLGMGTALLSRPGLTFRLWANKLRP
jgi:hypothetical protein